MIVIPAVDLREGHCVQLVGGSYDHEAIRLDDPLEVATKWEQTGFRTLHIIDLDAATGNGTNRDVILKILESTKCKTQVGGGIRTTEDVDDLLEAGADCVIVGTRAIDDVAWLMEVAQSNPGRVIVAVDIKDEKIVTRGWTATNERDFRLVVAELSKLPLNALLVTAVHREGLMQGPDLSLMREVLGHSSLPVQASGGIGSIENLRALKSLGVASVVLGMGLYTGALDPDLLLEEFVQ